MDGTTATHHLEMAILRLQGSIDLLELLDGMEDEINALYAVRLDLMVQLHELESIEGA